MQPSLREGQTYREWLDEQTIADRVEVLEKRCDVHAARIGEYADYLADALSEIKRLQSRLDAASEYCRSLEDRLKKVER